MGIAAATTPTIRSLVLGLAVAPCLVLGGPRPAPAQPAVRAYVLDSGAQALVALELPSGNRLATLPLEGGPEVLLQSPEGSRLVVLDRGPGDDEGSRGYKAEGKSSATIIDPATMSIVGRVELGSGVEAYRSNFSPDGTRLTVLCPGYEDKKPETSLARELVNIDLETGTEAGRLAVGHGAVPTVPSKTDRTLPLIQGLPRESKHPYASSRLWFVDLAGPSVGATLDMGTWESLYADGTHVYLLDPGKPHKDPRKNKNGSVQVVSVEQRTLVATLDAGRGPRGLYRDEEGEQVFILSERPPGAAGPDRAEMRVLRGRTLAATLEVAANPRMAVRHGDVVYVVGEKAVTLVDPVAPEVTATIPLLKGRDSLVDDDDIPTELDLSPDGKRAFILYGLHNKVVVLDLEANVAVGSTKTGRGGKKLFGNVLGGLAGMTFGGWADTLVSAAVGYPLYWFATPTMLTVRPDGHCAYALNTRTNDVTVVDATTAEAVEKIGAGGYGLHLLAGRTLAVVSGSELNLIDTTRNEKLAELELKDLRGLALAPDGVHAVALARGTVLYVDGATGEVSARLTDFVSPEAIVFERPAEPAGPQRGDSDDTNVREGSDNDQE